MNTFPRRQAQAGDPLTKRQKAIFDFIISQICAYGRQPSLREIMKRFGIKSPNGVAHHMKYLEKKGYISTDNTTRARGVMFPNIKFAIAA